jgi:hypothetical protein
MNSVTEVGLNKQPRVVRVICKGKLSKKVLYTFLWILLFMFCCYITIKFFSVMLRELCIEAEESLKVTHLNKYIINITPD